MGTGRPKRDWLLVVLSWAFALPPTFISEAGGHLGRAVFETGPLGMLVSVWAAAGIPENLRLGLAGWWKPGLDRSRLAASEALGPSEVGFISPDTTHIGGRSHMEVSPVDPRDPFIPRGSPDDLVRCVCRLVLRLEVNLSCCSSKFPHLIFPLWLGDCHPARDHPSPPLRCWDYKCELLRCGSGD